MIRVHLIDHSPDGRITPEQYEIVRPWWEARGGSAPTREMLPTLGVIAIHDSEPIACAFCYLDATGSGVAMLAWMATRPGADAYQAGRAIHHICDFIAQHASSVGYWLLMATYHHRSVISSLKRMGFRQGDTGMVQLFKTI